MAADAGGLSSLLSSSAYADAVTTLADLAATAVVAAVLAALAANTKN